MTSIDIKDLEQYFAATKGTGILSTSDDKGRVNAAIYARPHFLEDGTVAFVMRERLTHHNLLSNRHACYLYIEAQGNYQGKRLHLSKLNETGNAEVVTNFQRRQYPDDEEVNRYLVRFKIDRAMPLIGPGSEEPNESQMG
jgi:hypothetical protein